MKVVGRRASRPVALQPAHRRIALLKRTTRTATVRAVTKMRLLVLEIRDFHRLLEDHPEIAAAVEREADRRMNPAAEEPSGRGGPETGDRY